MADITATLQAKSNQLNASDLIGGPATVTVERVDVNVGAEQPVSVHLEGMKGRPYKPSKGMRRILADVWGKESDGWIGKRMTLWRNPDVPWAGVKVGGIWITAMSDMTGPHSTAVRLNSKQAVSHTIQPLPDAPSVDPWQPRWAQIEQALRGAGVSGDGPAILKAAGELIEAEFTHPQQITDDQARAIHAALNPDAATVATDNPENKES